VRLRADVAYEYLDDGGVLACQLSDGSYWQLGPPAGALWALATELSDFRAIAARLPEVVDVTPVEAYAGLEAFCHSLEVMELIEPGWQPQPSPTVAGDGER
jgi:hypothetical protein